MAAEVATRLVSRFAVLAGEDRDGMVGLGGVLHGHADARAHLAGSAATDGVHDEHRCAGLGDRRVDIGSGTGFTYTGAGKLFAHRNHHNFWIHVRLPGPQPVVIVAASCIGRTRDTEDAEHGGAAAYILDGVEVQEQVELSPHTTLKIGGPARFFIRMEEETDAIDAWRFAAEHGLKLVVLGGGSNLVVRDAGFNGVILHVASKASIVRKDVGSAASFDVGAGTDWDLLVKEVCSAGLSGMECLAGIPGTVGGSPIQNIGAYGQDVSQTITGVRALDTRTGLYREIDAAECGFAYRESIFNGGERGRYLVTNVRFRLQREARPNLGYADLAPLRETNPEPLDVYHAVRAIRDRKGMVIHAGADDPDTRSAGSFFKNPVVSRDMLAKIDGAPHWDAGGGRVKLPAAWLIEHAGFLKGFRMGPVGVSTRHTLALTNWSGKATCADLLALRDVIVAGVEERFGVKLEQEPGVLE